MATLQTGQQYSVCEQPYSDDGECHRYIDTGQGFDDRFIHLSTFHAKHDQWLETMLMLLFMLSTID